MIAGEGKEGKEIERKENGRRRTKVGEGVVLRRWRRGYVYPIIFIFIWKKNGQVEKEFKSVF